MTQTTLEALASKDLSFLPMFSDEKQLLAYMMRNYKLALALTEAASGKSKEFYSKAH